MALTYMEELKKKQQGQTAQQGGLSGVSENTRTQLQKYQNGYQPTQQATAAQNNLQNVQNQRPQTYNSKYGAQLDSILQEISNPGAFKYDMNGDTLFQSYKDLFTQQAKQGAQNAQGMAAALTGGYGNSYGLSAGAQAYQQALLPLYERIPEFAQLARQNYDANQDSRYRALGALQDADNTDYARSRDAMADWRDDVAMAQDAYRDERDFGYNDYMNQLNYWTSQAGAENADMRADQDEDFRQAQLAEQIRSTNLDNDLRNRSLDEQIRSTNLDNDYRNRTLDWNMATDARDYAENVRRADNDEAFRQAQLQEQIRSTNMDNDYRNRSLEEQIRSTNLDNDYRNWAMNEQIRSTNLENDYRNRSLDETIRQNDADNDYRNRSLNETIRQNDQDNDYRNRTLDWNMSTDQRDYEAQQYWNNENNKLDWASLEEKQRQFDANLTEEQRQYNQKVAIAYVTDILANGQMPSMELLIAAGLSYEDAQKLMAQIQSGGVGGTPKAEEPAATGKPMTFEEANLAIFRNTPDSLLMSDLGATANGDKTIGQYKSELEQAWANRQAAKNPAQDVTSKLQNAENTTSFSSGTKEMLTSGTPSTAEYIKWLKNKLGG